MRSALMILAVGIFVMTHASVHGAQIDQQDGQWVLSNNVYSLTVNPDAGGRIISWRENETGREYCYWAESGGHAGLLDDKGAFSSMPYDAAVVQNDPYCVQLRLTSAKSPNGLQIAKTISVKENHATLEVQYEYRNLSDKKYRDTLLVRNYALPGTAPASAMHYFLPSASGLKSWAYPYPDYESYFKELSDNWFAMVDQSISRGVTLLVDSDAFTGFYAFMARQNPTVEYLLELKLAPGKTETANVTFIMTRALTQVSHACPELVAAVNPKVEGEKLQIDVAMEPVAEVYEQTENPQATFELARLDGSQRTTLTSPEPAMLEAPVWPGQRSAGESTIGLKQAGTFTLRTQLRTSSRLITSWEQPFDIGEATSVYYRGEAQEKNTVVTMVFDEADYQRGYGIHAGGTVKPYQKVEQIDLHLGSDELESFEVGVIPLKAIGRTEVHIQNEDGKPTDDVQLRLLQQVDSRYDDAYALVPQHAFDGEPQRDTRIWLTLDTSALSAGTHRFQLAITPEQGDAASIPVNVTVWPVTKSPAANARLTMWYLLSDVLNSIGKDALADMRSYDVSEVKVNWKRGFWDDRVVVTRDEKGKIRADFSRVESVLQLARDEGMQSIGLMYVLTNAEWFRSLEPLTPQALEAAQHEVVRQMVEMLLRLGFERVEYFWTDEPPTTVGAKEAQELEKIRAIHPKLKIAMTVNHMSDRMMKELDPAVDVWYMSQFTADPRLRQIRSGKVETEAMDDVRIYYAHARIYRHSYADMRGHGWYSAWLGVNCYGVYNYFKPTVRPDRAVFVSQDHGILTTPAWEGVRDGFDDFAYLRKLQTMRDAFRASQHPQVKAAIKQADAFMTQAFSAEHIELEETYRYGHHFRMMKPTDSWTYNRLRQRLMAVLTDLEAAVREDER